MHGHQGDRWKTTIVLFLMLALFVGPSGRQRERAHPQAQEERVTSEDVAQEAERARQLEAARQQVLAERATRFRPVQLHAPFWRSGEGFRSLLMLNNTQPRRIDITPVVRVQSGEVLPARTIALGPLQSVDVWLEELIGKVAGQGQIALGYVGDPMEIVGQVLVVNEAAGLSLNQVFIPRSMCVAPRLEGVFFWPGEAAEGELVLANTDERTLSVTVGVYGGATGRQTLELGPHQIRVMDMREEVLAPAPLDAAVIGVSIVHTGEPGEALVQGWVRGPSGFGTNIRLVDIGMRQSGRLLSPALRLWEGMRPRLLLGNSGDRQQDVALLAHYRVNGQAVRKSLGRLVVGPQHAQVFDLEEDLQAIPPRAVDVGLELQHRGRGENLVADLVLVSEDGSEVIQVSPRDAVGEAYGGFNYPWRIGAEATTVIVVMNPSRVEEVNFSLFLFFGSESYTYEGGRLRPGEVRQVDIRTLRDRRVPDQFGRLLPRGVSAGQAKLVVHGVAGREESQRILGEAILVDGHRGIRATMACPNCLSRPIAVILSPGEIVDVFGTRHAVFARVYYEDGSSWGVNDPRVIEWFSTDSAVAEAEVVMISESRAAFLGHLKSPGAAQLLAVVSHCAVCESCWFPEQLFSNSIEVRVKPKVSLLAGMDKIPLDASGEGGVTRSIERVAVGEPAGGTYSWSANSTKVSLSNTASATVTVTSVSASTARNDVTLTVTYTVNGQSASASTTLTVVKPTSLERGADTFSPDGVNCSQVDPNLNCTSYLRVLTYTIKDQFGDTFGPWSFFADESFTEPSATGCAIRGEDIKKGPISGMGIGFTDNFFFCSAACPKCNPSGKGCTVNSTQTWRVNGFVVRRNNITWTCSDATITQIP